MQLPMFPPASEWVIPNGELPDLSNAREIAIDLETKDPHLETLGPGWARNDGEIVGIAIAVDGGSWYLPIRHYLGPNLDPKQTLRYVRNLLSVPDRAYIFHNAPYDVGWLWAEGIEVKGTIYDTMVAAPLLDENRLSYALNNLGRDYLNERKDERLLRDAAKEFRVDPKKELWKLPAIFVGNYAEQDAALTLKLWQRFRSLLATEELDDIFDIERRVQYVAIEMRKRGIRVDLERAARTKSELVLLEEQVLHRIKKEYSVDVELWSAASLATAFDATGIAYPRTPGGAPSFVKEFLQNHDHPLPQAIREAREINKAHSTFVDTILKHEYKGRIHCELHSLRSEDGGTVTGRFSCANPNLQQIPARNERIGPLMRSLFLPEEGQQWGAFDYSSQEPRILVHYASLLEFRGASAVASQYLENKDTDLHQVCADLMGIRRKDAKIINLGLFYGMGKKKLAASLGMDLMEAEELFHEYHNRVPFVLEMSNFCMRRATEKGVIRTVLGRKCRFDLWEPISYGLHKPLNHKEAFDAHGPAIRRAFTYRALNRLIQGSAADQTKKAMVDCYDAGFLPMLQVHDELDFSIENKEQARQIMDIMENCVKLEVPSLVDAEFGPTWGEAIKNEWST